jgi:hypothetical protein
MSERKMYYEQSRMTGISYKQQNEGRLPGLVTSYIRTAFIIEGKLQGRIEVMGR